MRTLPRRKTMSQVAPEIGEATIWKRLIDALARGLSADMARALLAIRFAEQDKARIDELGAKNQEARLTAAEKKELEAYAKVADVLALLHLNARKALHN